MAGDCECDDMPEDDTNDHNRRPGMRGSYGQLQCSRPPATRSRSMAQRCVTLVALEQRAFYAFVVP